MKKDPGRFAPAATILALWAGPGTAAAHPIPEETALAAEVARATSSLTMEDYPPPYFVSLRVADHGSLRIVYDLGRLAGEYRSRDRTLSTEVRVGGYGMDNHPMGPRQEAVMAQVAGEGDPFALAHEAWRTIDESYKEAAGGFLSRQAGRVERGKADYEADDMTREPPHSHEEPFPGTFEPPPSFHAGLEGVSRVLRGFPDLLGSGTQFERQTRHTHLINSEGARVQTTEEACSLEISAQAISSDGMRLMARRAYYARRPEGLPPWDKVRGEVQAMGESLRALSAAPSTAPFNAPALLDPSISGSIFSAIASRMEGEEQRNPQGGHTFRGKLGTKVLPEFLTLVDDPTLAEHGGLPLSGHYRFDDEGVPAQPVTLIEKGILRAFLLSRYPVVGLPPRSNGHGRAEPRMLAMARPGNLVLRSKSRETLPRLKARLLKECRARGVPAGLWIKRMLQWNQQSGTGEHQAFRAVPEEVWLVDARTGEERLVRGLDLVGTPLAMLANILATGDDEKASNFQDNQASGSVRVAVVSGTVLVSEVELQRSEGKPMRPPVLDSPKP